MVQMVQKLVMLSTMFCNICIFTGSEKWLAWSLQRALYWQTCSHHCMMKSLDVPHHLPASKFTIIKLNRCDVLEKVSSLDFSQSGLFCQIYQVIPTLLNIILVCIDNDRLQDSILNCVEENRVDILLLLLEQCNLAGGGEYPGSRMSWIPLASAVATNIFFQGSHWLISLIAWELVGSCLMPFLNSTKGSWGAILELWQYRWRHLIGRLLSL